MSGTLKEVKRLKGQSGIVLQNDSFRCARHSHDDSIIPWVRGENMVSLVTIRDLSMKEVKNFFGQENEDEVIPLICVCTSDGEKMFGTSLLKSKMRLSFWEKSYAPKYYQMNELYANGNVA
jgi:hypothetical protein